MPDLRLGEGAKQSTKLLIKPATNGSFDCEVQVDLIETESKSTF